MTDKKQVIAPKPNLIRRFMPSILMSGQAHRQKMAAEWMYERLVHAIIEFEESLDDEHEVAAQLVSFNDAETFNITDVGFWEPDLIVFFGTTSRGNRVQLMQHISQVNLMLVAIKKPEKKEPPRRIGFILEQKMPSKKSRKKSGRKTKSKSKN